jgi:hypothetical protein
MAEEMENMKSWRRYELTPSMDGGPGLWEGKEG